MTAVKYFRIFLLAVTCLMVNASIWAAPGDPTDRNRIMIRFEQKGQLHIPDDQIWKDLTDPKTGLSFKVEVLNSLTSIGYYVVALPQTEKIYLAWREIKRFFRLYHNGAYGAAIDFDPTHPALAPDPSLLPNKPPFTGNAAALSLKPQAFMMKAKAGSKVPPPPNCAMWLSGKEPFLVKVGMQKAWKYSTGDRSVIVAILDTGVDYDHPDLMHNIWKDKDGNPGYNFVVRRDEADYETSRFKPLDDNGHGTWIAGLIGADGQDPKGAVGINWNVGLMPLKVFDGDRQSELIDEVLAFEYVHRQKAIYGQNVVATCNSWIDGDQVYPPLKEILAVLKKDNIVNCFAAGDAVRYALALPKFNDCDLWPTYPACLSSDDIIAVAASPANSKYSVALSRYGHKSIHLAAPGAEGLEVSTMSRLVDPIGFGYLGGTSAATPYVAGAVALLAARAKQKGQTLTIDQLKNLIMSNVDRRKSWSNKVKSGGIINIGRAMQALAKGQTSQASP